MDLFLIQNVLRFLPLSDIFQWKFVNKDFLLIIFDEFKKRTETNDIWFKTHLQLLKKFKPTKRLGKCVTTFRITRLGIVFQFVEIITGYSYEIRCIDSHSCVYVLERFGRGFKSVKFAFHPFHNIIQLIADLQTSEAKIDLTTFSMIPTNYPTDDLPLEMNLKSTVSIIHLPISSNYVESLKVPTQKITLSGLDLYLTFYERDPVKYPVTQTSLIIDSDHPFLRFKRVFHFPQCHWTAVIKAWLFNLDDVYFYWLLKFNHKTGLVTLNEIATTNKKTRLEFVFNQQKNVIEMYNYEYKNHWSCLFQTEIK